MNKKEGKTTKRNKKQVFAPGWDENQVREVIDYYAKQTEEEQVAEHEAPYKAAGQTMMGVPTDLVPQVRQLIARRRGA
jgi:hypothetical protein